MVDPHGGDGQYARRSEADGTPYRSRRERREAMERARRRRPGLRKNKKSEPRAQQVTERKEARTSGATAVRTGPGYGREPGEGHRFDDVHHEEHHDVEHHDDHHDDHTGEFFGFGDTEAAPEAMGRRFPLLRWVTVAVAVVAVVFGATYAAKYVSPVLGALSLSAGKSEDFEGPGKGEATVVVPNGASVSKVAQVLEDEGVVKDADTFATVAANDPRWAELQPGTYALKKEMTSVGALDALMEPANREVLRATIPEGRRASEVFEILAEKTDHDVKEYEAVDPEELDLPDSAKGQLEGYLYPATYEFQPGDEPKDQLQTLVDESKKQLKRFNVSDKDAERIMTIASIVQAEGRSGDDMPKVASVIENRVADGMPLQMDSTLHYQEGTRGNIFTSDELRRQDTPYNSYLRKGLPPTPIGNPGATAIRSAVEPAPGDYLYFVTVNLDTGETKFAETYGEHQENQAEFQKWCRDNPGKCQ